MQLRPVKDVPNFIFTLDLSSSNGLRTLYCITGRVLVDNNTITVKHYVDNINRKYNVAMATSPPTVNMADTLRVLNLHFARGGK